MKEVVNFEDADIRFAEEGGQTWYSVVDVVGALSGSSDPRNYWKVLKSRLKKEGSELVTKCNRLKLLAQDGKYRQTDCLLREDILRLVQSIPSPKAESFKLFLANAGEQNIQETENPFLLMSKLKESLRKKGYDEEWINTRLRSILVRDQLTEEWQQRGIQGREYGILTDEIMKGTFGLTTSEHKALKGLVKENLRDNMSNMELIFTMLGEETARTLSIKNDAQGFQENQQAAAEGGRLAGESRERLEQKIGISVVTGNNQLDRGK